MDKTNTSNMNIISAMTANSLYWLGRYEERVYMTLHIMRKYYDKLIDSPGGCCANFISKIDAGVSCASPEELMQKLVYDVDNPSSLISAQTRARDNAMLLRDIILSETLSYLEMTLALMQRNAKAKDYRIESLQPITDWSLAFFGSAQQRIYKRKIVSLMLLGRCVENLDMMLRFDYPPFRIAFGFEALEAYCKDIPHAIDEHILSEMKANVAAYNAGANQQAMQASILHLANVLVRV